jgi:hypothetical protein
MAGYPSVKSARIQVLEGNIGGFLFNFEYREWFSNYDTNSEAI